MRKILYPFFYTIFLLSCSNTGEVENKDPGKKEASIGPNPISGKEKSLSASSTINPKLFCECEGLIPKNLRLPWKNLYNAAAPKQRDCRFNTESEVTKSLLVYVQKIESEKDFEREKGNLKLTYLGNFQETKISDDVKIFGVIGHLKTENQSGANASKKKVILAYLVERNYMAYVEEYMSGKESEVLSMPLFLDNDFSNRVSQFCIANQ